jgi:drug/metabolite transporter (DMT)-like permease
MFLSSAISIVVSLAALPLQSRWGGWPAALHAREIALLFATGALGAVSQWFFIRAYVWSSASFIAPLLFLQLVWSTAAGWLYFAQLPDTTSLVGIAISLASGVLTMFYAARRARPVANHDPGAKP